MICYETRVGTAFIAVGCCHYQGGLELQPCGTVAVACTVKRREGGECCCRTTCIASSISILVNSKKAKSKEMEGGRGCEEVARRGGIRGQTRPHRPDIDEKKRRCKKKGLESLGWYGVLLLW